MDKNKSLSFSFLFLISILFLGCTQKEIKVVPKFIKTPCHYPKLKVYNDTEKLNLTIKPQDGKVCIKEWKTCIPTNEFMKMVKYIKNKETIIEKYKSEIKIYNNTYIKEDK